MSFGEKSAWAFGASMVAGTAAYLAVVVPRALSTPIEEVAYAGPMLWTIGGIVLATVIGSVLAIIVSTPRDADIVDERDADIGRHSDTIGLLALSLGVMGALALTLANFKHFWIANTIFFAFVVSALAGTVAKLVAYRRGYP